MPVVMFDADTLRRLMGADTPTGTLAERMPMLGGDLERVDGEAITIEWFPDRPDLLSVEGAARALRAFLDVEPGMPEYEAGEPSTELHVDAAVAAVRPHAALCFVRGVALDEEAVGSLVEAQEKLTLSPGRRRRKIAIGIHDAAGLQGPFTYTCVAGEEKPFVPLGSQRRMTPREVLEAHPKGRAFAHLVPDDAFPVFLDGAGEVLSMPPIINAARTAVTAATRDILLDVTGTDAEGVRRTVALLAAGLADRGGRIEAVTVHDASGTWTCPDLRTTEQVLHADDVRRLLGVDMDGDHIAACLRRMGHAVEAFGNRVLVRSPAWRFDLLHPVDWMEDVAIGHGFENFRGTLPSRGSFGGALPDQSTEDRVRATLCGLGFSEARTLTLSDPHHEWEAWGAPPTGAVTLRNAVLEERCLLRTHVTPGLLSVLARNRHRGLPQRLWEMGEIVARAEDPAAPARNRLRVAVVETGARTGFAEAKGLVEALLRDLGWEARLRPAKRPGFIPGRQGDVVRGDQVVGHFGELHPDTLVAFGLGAATAAVEMDVDAWL